MTTRAFSRNVGKIFSKLKLVIDNLLFIYAAANWEATESITQLKRGIYWIAMNLLIFRERETGGLDELYF